MNRFRGVALGGALFIAAGTMALAEAARIPGDVLNRMAAAEIVLLGEVHDNPYHHLVQAEVLRRIQPKAVVWEMIAEDKVSGLTSEVLSDPSRLEAELNWTESGWPDFSLYEPVFDAASGARPYGAQISRSAARSVMQDGVLSYFGPDAARFGLDMPLEASEQKQREKDQLAAHCDALPQEMLPMMVDFQRLRDANLARVALRALDETGGPVAVVTGNGHARKDRGIPVYLLKARPGLDVFSLGQSEDGVSAGDYDHLLDAPAVDRPDPCLAFSQD